MIDPSLLERSIPSRPYAIGELRLDRCIHHLGIAAGGIGGLWLTAAAVQTRSITVLVSVLVYSTGLMAMLLCSSLYNRARGGRRRRMLRRLDHAAIFIMIAGTYTPFATRLLPAWWSIGMISVMWGVAVTGAVLKFAYAEQMERISVVPYLVLGWGGLIVLQPVLAALDAETLALLATGAVLYTLGTLFHLWSRLPYHSAIWHGFVLTAAACHYAAILRGVVAA